MNEHPPMMLKDLKTKMTLVREIKGERMSLLVSHIGRKLPTGERLVKYMRTDARHYGERYEGILSPDEELEVYSDRPDRDGVRLYPGMTQAEIEVRQIAVRAQRAGREVVVEIRPDASMVFASIYVKGRNVWDNSYLAMWRTRIDGRRTTAFSGAHLYRGVGLSKRQRVSVRIGRREFFSKLYYDVCYDVENTFA